MPKYIALGGSYPQITYYTEDDPFSSRYGTGDKVVVAVSHDLNGTEIGIAAQVKKSLADRMTWDDLLMLCDRLAFSIVRAREERYARSQTS